MKLIDSLVSIVIPAYNASHVLPRSIQSLLKQTYEHLEILIVDDCSRDDTYKTALILKKFDKRIKVFRNKKRYGPAVCFNRAMRFARGQFITFMHATDVASRHKIKKQVAFLKANQKIVCVGTQCITINNAQKKQKSLFPTEHEAIYSTLLQGLSMRFETALINRLLLPKDLIKFTTNTYPFLFSNLFMKLASYGKMANLKHHLYWHYEEGITQYKKQNTKSRLLSYGKLFLESFTDHAYRPSLKAFLQPFISPVRTFLQ